jgi:predicted solute-binding protein
VLSLAISSCPNDTFVFCHMTTRYKLTLNDVETLNRCAERGEFDILVARSVIYGVPR